jgi:hypothetical protein
MQQAKEANYDAYLSTDLKNLTGEWVIFSNGELVAHDKNLKRAVEKARSAVGDRRLMIAKVPDKETMIYPA